MKTLKKTDYCSYLTIAFYVAFASLPFIASGGNNIADNFRLLFINFPSNILLYIFPLIFFLFIRKIDLPETDKTAYTLFFFITVLVLTADTISSARNSFPLTIFAILLLSVICINRPEPVSALILIPGLFISVLELPYIFAAYIPVLILQLFRFAVNRNNGKKDSPFILCAYLYISVLTVILLFSGKLKSNYIRMSHNFLSISYILKFASGFIILMLLSAIFILRAFPRNGRGSILTKTATILTVIYPSGLLIANCFYNVVSNNIQDAFIFAYGVVLCGNLLLSISGNEKTSPFITEKMKKTYFIIPVAVLFCMLCFE